MRSSYRQTVHDHSTVGENPDGGRPSQAIYNLGQDSLRTQTYFRLSLSSSYISCYVCFTKLKFSLSFGRVSVKRGPDGGGWRMGK